MDTTIPHPPLNQKLVIIINGKGGAGKDTLCDIAAQYYRTENISAITPIKDIARQFGWNGEKDARARKFLADLKRAFVDYCDLPNAYLEAEYRRFAQSDSALLFVHIRETDQIDDFKRRVAHRCVTLLVRSPRIEARYGNDADDLAENYPYDYCYRNEKPLEELAPDFMEFLAGIFAREGLTEGEKGIEKESLPVYTEHDRKEKNNKELDGTKH